MLIYVDHRDVPLHPYRLSNVFSCHESPAEAASAWSLGMGCVTTSSAVARQKSTIDGVYHPWTVGYQKKSLLVTGPFSYAGDVYIYI